MKKLLMIPVISAAALWGFDLNLHQGWNLITLPVNQNLPSDSFSTFGNYRVIFTYQNGQWTKSTPTSIAHTGLSYGEGFWIYRDDAGIVSFSDGASYSFSPQASPGWNLLGAGENLSDPRDAYGFAQTWTYDDQQWFLNPSLIERGSGFWAYQSTASSSTNTSCEDLLGGQNGMTAQIDDETYVISSMMYNITNSSRLQVSAYNSSLTYSLGVTLPTEPGEYQCSNSDYIALSAKTSDSFGVANDGECTITLVQNGDYAEGCFSGTITDQNHNSLSLTHGYFRVPTGTTNGGAEEQFGSNGSSSSSTPSYDYNGNVTEEICRTQYAYLDSESQAACLLKSYEEGWEMGTISDSSSSSSSGSETETPVPISTDSTTGFERYSCQDYGTLKSGSGNSMTFSFYNASEETVKLQWIDYSGGLVNYSDVAVQSSYQQSTYTGHYWMVTDTSGNCLEIILPSSGNSATYTYGSSDTSTSSASSDSSSSSTGSWMEEKTFTLDECQAMDGSWTQEELCLLKWDDAVTYCTDQGGRLPSITEMTAAWEAGGSLTSPDKTEGFARYRYWTGEEMDDYNAYLFSFGTGTSMKDYKTSLYNAIRCIQ